MSTITDDAAYAAEAARLAAERQLLAALPSVPAGAVEVETGQTVGQWWNSLDPAGRHGELLAAGNRVYFWSKNRSATGRETVRIEAATEQA